MIVWLMIQYTNQWNSKERSNRCFDRNSRNTLPETKQKNIFATSASFLNFLEHTINITLNQLQCFIVSPEMKVLSSIALYKTFPSFGASSPMVSLDGVVVNEFLISSNCNATKKRWLLKWVKSWKRGTGNYLSGGEN